jgi:hypothetical protein
MPTKRGVPQLRERDALLAEIAKRSAAAVPEAIEAAARTTLEKAAEAERRAAVARSLLAGATEKLADEPEDAAAATCRTGSAAWLTPCSAPAQRHRSSE